MWVRRASEQKNPRNPPRWVETAAGAISGLVGGEFERSANNRVAQDQSENEKPVHWG
jgi:hypothetical protein